ncbi:plasmalemma vesicle associated protein a isoform X2 [Lampris incognitus]|uniref:plasmalemma vesicle associated protein a isoform X2 n=1 Tax=Lampris incognitus TaxID=2546036 RepID=UPI0024B5E949|nr:plasmalemma vesicle associated protein a isoform X2 [Lampris incognitus]
MYNNGYSQVSKFSLEAQKRKMQQRPKGKSCGYYMRIIFFFSSLIQSLIIVSLVLFLVYGKQQDSASTARLQDQDERLQQLFVEKETLRLQKENLTTVLNITLTEKLSNDRVLTRLRSMANISINIINTFNAKLGECNMELLSGRATRPAGCPPCSGSILGNCNCGVQVEQLRAKAELLRSNFTQTTQMLRIEMDQVSRERDNINLEAIKLRRDKSMLEEEMAAYRAKCKQDFANSLSGISNVSRAFLGKIDTLFPQHIPFQLTCQKQRENLEQIRNNCTSLSREVEDKFQRYLDSVGAKVSQIQAESSHLKVENKRLSEDHHHCSLNRSNLIYEHRQNVQKVQLKCDKEKEKVLMEKKKLTGDKELLQINNNLKDTEIRNLKDQIKQLNASCPTKRGFGLFPSLTNMGNVGFGQNPFLRTGSAGSSTSLGSTGTVNLYQHLQELQRFANPSASKEKPDASRTSG